MHYLLNNLNFKSITIEIVNHPRQEIFFETPESSQLDSTAKEKDSKQDKSFSSLEPSSINNTDAETHSNQQQEGLSRALVSFSEKIGKVNNLEELILFLSSQIPKKFKVGELILFYNSKQFGLRRVYMRKSIVQEEHCQNLWPLAKKIKYSDRSESLYLAQEMGRPFSKVLIMPLPLIPSADSMPSVSSSFSQLDDTSFIKKTKTSILLNSSQENKNYPVFFVEMLRSHSKEQEIQNFFSERQQVLNLILNRILSSNSAKYSSYLWENVFGKWNEPLAIIKNPKKLKDNEKHKTQVLKSNKAFDKLSEFCPQILDLKTQHGHFVDIDRTTYRIHYYPIPIQKKSKNLGIFYCEDMTQQFDLKERFFRSEKMLALYELGKNMAHELNNPLTGIRSMSQILSQHEGLQKFQQEFQELEGAAARCQNIIEKLLTFSQFQKQDSLNCSINTVVEDSLNFLKLITSGILIQVDCPKKDIQVAGDGSVFQQVIYNLIINACQALKEFKQQAKPSIKISVDASPTEKIFLKVQDNGPGIAKQHLEKIFQPLWTTKIKGEGTGLGLGIARYMLNRLGASIEVSSRCVESAPHAKDSWTCFTLTIPKAKDE